MKVFLLLCFLGLLIWSPTISAQGESRPPKPKFSAAQAIERVTKYLGDHEKNNTNTFITSVIYGRPDRLHLAMNNNEENVFVRDAEEEWSWFVTLWTPSFAPRQVYRLKNDGTIEPLISTSS